jgi:prefoldin subunit 5
MAVKNVQFDINVNTNAAIKNIQALDVSLQNMTKTAQAATQAAAAATTAFNNVQTNTTVNAASGIGAVGGNIGNLNRQVNNPNLTYAQNSVNFMLDQINVQKRLLDNLDSGIAKNIPLMQKYVYTIQTLGNAINEIRNAGTDKEFNLGFYKKNINELERRIDDYQKKIADFQKKMQSSISPNVQTYFQERIDGDKEALKTFQKDLDKYKILLERL